MQKMEVVQDEQNELEFDDISYSSFESEKKMTDPFLSVKMSSLSPRMKRKAQRLHKKYEGEDGTATKYIDPLVVNGYSLWDIINPPYDLDNLANLYDHSSIHYAAINARVMNTVGLGYEFHETLKAKRKVIENKYSEDINDMYLQETEAD